MPDERYEERTEPATPRRRQEARGRGQVARSIDLSAAIVLLASLVALSIMGATMGGSIAGLTVNYLENYPVIAYELAERPGELGVAHYLAQAFAAVLPILLPFLVVVVIAALAVQFVQVGFYFSFESMRFDVSRLNPVAGMSRFFTTRGTIRALMSVAKLLVLLGVTLWTIWQYRFDILATGEMDFPAFVRFMTESAIVLGIRLAIALLALAILDFAYQRFQYEADLKMTKQEVKEEMKRYEGDPKIKERRRQIQMRLAVQRMLGKVPRATVVVTNPTEYAVALQYDEGMAAPVVTAKGTDRLAERIRNIAIEHGVPIHRRPELARALYAAVEVDQSIPVEFYAAVAEVLALVYRTRPAAGAVAP